MSKRDAKIFISYKTDASDPNKSTGLSQSAHMLRRELEHRQYDVWMDQVGIHVGDNWFDAIIDGMRDCDIILLLLSDKSEESQGQALEIVQARTLKKAILPVVIRGNFDAGKVLESKFKLQDTQFYDFRIGHNESLRGLIAAIELTAKKLNLNTPDPRVKRKSRDEIRPHQEQYALYGLKGHDCKIFLAVGNVMNFENIDVVVNTENAYLQMARIFESSTISALLRYEGSYFTHPNEQLIEDTVQEELDGLIAQSRGTSLEIKLPAPFGTVLVTSAGHPESNLRKAKKPRYIFHTVAVNVRGTSTDKYMDPARDGEIKKCTFNTLDMVSTVNKNKGLVSPPNTGKVTVNGEVISERDRQIEISKKAKRDKGSYKDITSIVLPLFASGHAGIPVEEVESVVMQPICDGIKDFLERDLRKKNDKTTLKEIYICVYGYKLLPHMQKVIEDYFDLIQPPRNPVL